jgi:hypothetical protein
MAKGLAGVTGPDQAPDRGLTGCRILGAMTRREH